MPDHTFAIVGCGAVADFHARAINELDDARLVAACDPREDSARRFAATYGVDWYVDTASMLARCDVEIVCVCTPSGAHLEPALQAIEAGKHVVVEKPLEITPARCDAIISAAEARGVKLSGILQARFAQASQYARQVVRDGLLGRPTLASAYNKWWRAQDYYDGSQWRGTWEMDGGGALMNQGIHAVDLLLWLMGPVRDVCAQAATLCHDGIEVEDTLVATLRFENGALGVIEAATSVYPGMARRLELAGSNGTIAVEDERITRHEFSDATSAPQIPAELLEPAPGHGGAQNPVDIGHVPHRMQLQDMIEAIQQDRAPMIDGHEARRSIELIHAIYQSVREHRSVPLPVAETARD